MSCLVHLSHSLCFSESIKRIEKMCEKTVPFEKVDLVDYTALEKVFDKVNTRNQIVCSSPDQLLLDR